MKKILISIFKKFLKLIKKLISLFNKKNIKEQNYSGWAIGILNLIT